MKRQVSGSKTCPDDSVKNGRTLRAKRVSAGARSKRTAALKDGTATKGLAVGDDVDQSRRSSLSTRQPRGLTDTIVWRAVAALKGFPGNPRQHPERQLANLMKNIQRVWTNPILVDETCTILAGHGRLEAAKRLGMAEVPTMMICGLDENEKRAVVIADNRLPEGAVWDLDLLRGHFKDLIKIDFDVELSGFSTGEIDLLMDSTPKSATVDPADDLTGLTLDWPVYVYPAVPAR